MIGWRAASAAVAVVVAGCATPYGSSGVTGGHWEARVNDRLLKVNFSGNAYIDADKVQAFAMYRCAELAREAKKPYFVVYDSLHAAARDHPASQPRVGTIGGKPAAFAFLMLEDRPRAGAHVVAEVVARLQPLIDAAAAQAQGVPK